MNNREKYEGICFRIISAAGTAKSCFLEAIEAAKANEEYQSVLNEGNSAFMEATKAHTEALQLDATQDLDIGLLLIHAETILSSAETIRDLSGTIIKLIEK